LNNEAFLVLDRLDKSFGELHVLDSISLDVAEGELLALLGPSGSGKTTALRLLAGFETPNSGKILVGGTDVSPLPPARRGFGMVFQHYALFPHLDVGQNVAFGLERRGWDEARKRKRIGEVLELVNLPGFESRKLSQVSGGQQQRVALARALAPEPRLLLLDEPLSNLDPTLRENTRRQLRQAVEKVGITTILVTHEQEEAFHMGDRVAVLQDGRLQQVGAPEDLYLQPQSRFVAGFVGRSSILPGELAAVEGDQARVRLDVAPGAGEWTGLAVPPPPSNRRVELIVRPEALRFASSPGAAGALPGVVEERRYGGPVTYFQVRLAGPGNHLIEVLADANAARIGDSVGVTLSSKGPTPRVFSALEEP